MFTYMTLPKAGNAVSFNNPCNPAKSVVTFQHSDTEVVSNE